jgi:hypothetical protein
LSLVFDMISLLSLWDQRRLEWAGVAAAAAAAATPAAAQTCRVI